MGDKYVPRLKSRYDEVVAKAMTERFGYKNAMEVPKIEKITINMGVGEGSQDKKKVQTAADEMALISGQKPVITKAKSRSRSSSCVKACRSVARLPCAASGCTSSSIV